EDVGEHRHPREQVEILEDESHGAEPPPVARALAEAGEIDSCPRDHAALRDLDPGQDVEERRLAAAGGPSESDSRARGEGEGGERGKRGMSSASTIPPPGSV